MPDYEWNKQGQIMGDELIKEVHTHLEGLKIAYLFKQTPDYDNPKRKIKPKYMRQGKKITLAKARLVGRIYEDLLAQNFKFIIEFDRDRWDMLTLPQQRALVDNELSHCGNDADGCYLKQHDLEEFRGVVERNGLWKSDIEAFAESIDKQRSLALD